jgi:hypothetical protein
LNPPPPSVRDVTFATKGAPCCSAFSSLLYRQPASPLAGPHLALVRPLVGRLHPTRRRGVPRDDAQRIERDIESTSRRPSTSTVADSTPTR